MGLDQLVDSLLYEGYALFPYTPGATKNATPTPFGIVYPPVYAAECSGAHDHARLECVAVEGEAAGHVLRAQDPGVVGEPPLGVGPGVGVDELAGRGDADWIGMECELRGVFHEIE